MSRIVILAMVLIVAACSNEASDDRFTFIVNADPQMGEQDSKNRGIKQLNRLLEHFVANVNEMEQQPAFVVFNGDLVAFPRQKSFDNFVRLVKPMKAPVKLVHGNHDGRFPDTKFLDAQEVLSGERNLQYSFDKGQWHFTVIPAPEMTPEKEQRDALLAWLRQDLDANNERPTMVFMHYHVLPVGLSQLEYYTLEMGFKRALLDVLSEAGNVKYVFSGHVHAGVKASIRTAWNYRGVNYVIAPSPVWPRAFGDEFPEFLEAGDGEDMGYYLEIKIDGNDAKLFGRKIDDDIRRGYPKSFPTFTEDQDPRALKTLVEATPSDDIVNGDFEDGLEGWLGPYRYRFGKPRAFVRQARPSRSGDGDAAYLRVIPISTAWTHDESEELYQVVSWSPEKRPLVKFDYRVPPEGYTKYGGGYFRITGFSESNRVFSEFFHFGARENRARHLPLIFDYIATGDELGLQVFQGRASRGEALSWKIPEFGVWRPLQINVADLWERSGKKPRQWQSLQVDRLSIAFGVWTGPLPESGGAMWVDNVSISEATDEPTILGKQEAVISPRARTAPYGSHYLDRVGM